MYDSGKIIPGLVIFVGLVTSPLWLNHGKAVPSPQPKTDTPAIQQLEKKAKRLVIIKDEICVYERKEKLWKKLTMAIQQV